MISALILGALVAQATPSPSLPGYTPPAGWVAKPAPHVERLTWESPVDWHMGRSKITFAAVSVNLTSIEQVKKLFDAAQADTPKIPGASLDRDELVPICGGTQQGWLMVRTFSADGSAERTMELDTISRGLDYQLVFEAPSADPIPNTVLASLSTLCVP